MVDFKSNMTLNSLSHFVLLIITIISCNNCRKYYLSDVINKEIKGHIVNKYYDYDNHGTPMIVISNGSNRMVYNLMDIHSLYENCVVDDSIYRTKGSLKYTIYHLDSVKFFYPRCHGEIMMSDSDSIKHNSYYSHY